MDMRVTSVNIGVAETIERDGRTRKTGIRKRPVRGAVRISRLAVGDDVVCDREHHGGPDQAVYAYSDEDYRWWSQQLGRRMLPGSFGENLTIAGLPVDLCVGDRLLIGDVVLEATAPRIPCGTLAAQMRDRRFGTAFRRAERPGIYFRVLNEGEIGAGDFATLVEQHEHGVAILDLFRFAYDPSPAMEQLESFLEAPVSARMRRKIETRLAAARSS